MHHRKQLLPALLAEVPPRQVTRRLSPESYSSTFPAPVPPFFPMNVFILLSHFKCTCLVTRPEAARTTFAPRLLPLFVFLSLQTSRGGWEYNLHLRPQVSNQVSQWSFHSTSWLRASRGLRVQLHPPTEQRTMRPSVNGHAFPLGPQRLCSLHEFTLLFSSVFRSKRVGM